MRELVLVRVRVRVPAQGLELVPVQVPAREPVQVLARELVQVLVPARAQVRAQGAERPAKAAAALRRHRCCNRSTSSTWRRRIRVPSARPRA